MKNAEGGSFPSRHSSDGLGSRSARSRVAAAVSAVEAANARISLVEITPTTREPAITGAPPRWRAAKSSAAARAQLGRGFDGSGRGGWVIAHT